MSLTHEDIEAVAEATHQKVRETVREQIESAVGKHAEGCEAKKVLERAAGAKWMLWLVAGVVATVVSIVIAAARL